MKEPDALDQAILETLQADGRMSNLDLAERVGLTPAPCMRRVRRLEADGVIAGYRAVINHEKLGRRLEVTAAVEVRSTDTQTISEFERAVVAFDEVVEVRKVFGNPDYLLRIVVSDVEEYEQFQMQKLTALPAVFRVDSHQTMKLLKS